jgi:ABC-type proline/glycine betaine transport system ATPase subunit
VGAHLLLESSVMQSHYNNFMNIYKTVTYFTLKKNKCIFVCVEGPSGCYTIHLSMIMGLTFDLKGSTHLQNTTPHKDRACSFPLR